MFSVIASVIVYVILAVLITISMPEMSIVVFAVLIYIVPVVCNGALSVWALHNRNLKPYTVFLFPLFAFCSYVITSWILDDSGKWQQFAENNNTATEEMYIEVVDSLLEPSQVIFTALLYFTIQAIVVAVIITRRGGQVTVAGKSE